MAMTSSTSDFLSAKLETVDYSFVGVVDFLQQEWRRFERDRAKWELERAELLAKVAHLEGERKGQEALKHDLLRRIKMLEYALKQERMKYSTSQTPTDSPSIFVNKVDTQTEIKVKKKLAY